jgi:hypothetical protein
MKMLKPLVEIAKGDWDQPLAAALFAYRTAPHASTGQTPFYMVHGRDPDLPGENPLYADTRAMDPRSYVAQLTRNLHTAWTEASRQIKLSQTAYKAYFDRRARVRDFQIGDLVLMKHRERIDPKRMTNKFHPEFERLYRVTQVKGQNLLLAFLGAARRPAKWYNTKLVKHFGGSAEDYAHYDERVRANNNADSMDLDYECGECKGKLSTDNESDEQISWIECDACLTWYHYQCVGLLAEPIASIWYCPSCMEQQGLTTALPGGIDEALRRMQIKPTEERPIENGPHVTTTRTDQLNTIDTNDASQPEDQHIPEVSDNSQQQLRANEESQDKTSGSTRRNRPRRDGDIGRYALRRRDRR